MEFSAVVVLLAAQPQEILRHARHDVAVDLHVYVALRRLQLAVPLLVCCIVESWIDINLCFCDDARSGGGRETTPRP